MNQTVCGDYRSNIWFGDPPVAYQFPDMTITTPAWPSAPVMLPVPHFTFGQNDAGPGAYLIPAETPKKKRTRKPRPRLLLESKRRIRL